MGGCGQSPPVSPRDGCVASAASWGAKGYASVFPARLPAVPDWQSAPTFCSLPRRLQNQARQLCSVFAPQGQTASNTHTGSAPLPAGQGSVAQRAAGGRPLLVGLPPSAPTAAPSEPKRSAPAPCSWGGRASPWGRRRWLPALPAPRKNSPRTEARTLTFGASETRPGAGPSSPFTSARRAPAGGTGCHGRGNIDNRRSAL